MNNKAIAIFAFTIGAAIGSVVTWKLVKTKYEQLAQEEINSVKEVFAGIYSDADIAIKPPVKERDPILDVYDEVVTKCGYRESYRGEDLEEGGDPMRLEPYVIPPEEFDEVDGYKAVSLTYFADGVLYDDVKQKIVDIGVIGAESLTHFGEYEEDSVFVRNERTKTDYEILLDTKNYSDIHKPTSGTT